MSKSTDKFVRIRKDTKKKLDAFAARKRISFIEAARVAADALESMPPEKQNELLESPVKQLSHA